MARVWEDVLAGIQSLHERLDRIEAKLAADAPEAAVVAKDAGVVAKDAAVTADDVDRWKDASKVTPQP